MVDKKLKNCVFILKICLQFVLLRNFGNILHDFAQKYEGEFSKSDFRKLEKLYTKSNKAELDIKFLKNCQSFNVFPKFVCFNIPTITIMIQYLSRKSY